MHSTPTAAKAQRTKPTQAAVCVSAAVSDKNHSKYMQLDIDKPFSTQIKNLSGTDFENLVASSYYYLGYTIFRNLKVNVEKQNAAEIDVLATLLTPLNEIRLAIECKGANPSFNELRKFSTIRKIIESDYYLTDLFAYGANTTRKPHETFANLLGVKLLKKEDLSKKVLPILWGTGELRKDRLSWINRYLAIFTIEDYLIRLAETAPFPNVKSEFSNYIRFLQCELWGIMDPLEQIQTAFDKAQGEFNGFSAKIAGLLGLNISDELRRPSNELVQAAILLELKHRYINICGISRCSIMARTIQGRDLITKNKYPILRDVINALCDYNISTSKFSHVIFRWIYLWGGVKIKINNSFYLDEELISKETGLSANSFNDYLNIFRLIFSSGKDLFYETNNMIFLKYVPSHYRALGLLHRRSLDSEYNKMTLFYEDSFNLKLLDLSLKNIGGHGGLRFK